MFSFNHTFAGNPLDRAESIRRDDNKINELIHSSEGKYLVFDRLRVLVDDNNNLSWVLRSELPIIAPEPTLLGFLDQTPHFAIDLTDNEWAKDKNFQDCRTTAMQIETTQTGILAQARAQLDWHRKNQFCGVCGHPNKRERGGQVLRCSSCERHIFPRTDPVVIMLVVEKINGDRCLLGKGHGRMQSNFYSALAGFLDQGESIEEAVRREVSEEAGLQVGRVEYHSSQPWPFPSSLMIGCHAVAKNTKIKVNESEMADVSWFTREEVLSALAQKNPSLSVPGEIAIAHHLIKAWAAGEVEF